MTKANLTQSNFASRRDALKKIAVGASLPLSMPILLTACQTASVERPPLTQQGGRLNLGVAAIDVINDHQSPIDPIYIDAIFNPSPSTKMMSWIDRKLSPQDDEGNLLITITNAAMTERDIQGDQSLKSLFTNEQRLLITVEFEAVFSFSHPMNNRSATVTIASDAQSSIADNTSPSEADVIRVRVIDEALGRFDQECRRQLRAVSDQSWPLIG